MHLVWQADHRPFLFFSIQVEILYAAARAHPRYIHQAVPLLQQ